MHIWYDMIFPIIIPQDSQPHKEHVLKGQNDGIAFLAWSPNDNLLLSCGREETPEIMVFLTEVRV